MFLKTYTPLFFSLLLPITPLSIFFCPFLMARTVLDQILDIKESRSLAGFSVPYISPPSLLVAHVTLHQITVPERVKGLAYPSLIQIRNKAA